MLRAMPFIFSALLLLAATARARDDRPLGDIARATRAANSSSPKSAKIVTNDDVPSGKAQGSAGPLSTDKQAYCDELRRQKNTAAEQSCVLLGIDMGPVYENVTARYLSLAAEVCSANHGQLPVSEPADPSLAEEWRELNRLAAKYAEMMQVQIRAQSDVAKPVSAIQQAENRELAADVPDFRNPAVLSRNPRELQRYHEIENKYKPLIAAQEQAPPQVKLELQRYLVDLGRLQRVCVRGL